MHNIASERLKGYYDLRRPVPFNGDFSISFFLNLTVFLSKHIFFSKMRLFPRHLFLVQIKVFLSRYLYVILDKIFKRVDFF